MERATRATTQERAMRRNITIQAPGETHVPAAASAYAEDISSAYSFWGGVRKGYLTDPYRSFISNIPYVTYHVGNIPVSTCPLPIAFTWIHCDYGRRKAITVPSVWSWTATDFYHQLECKRPDTVAPNTFPCSLKTILP